MKLLRILSVIGTVVGTSVICLYIYLTFSKDQTRGTPSILVETDTHRDDNDSNNQQKEGSMKLNDSNNHVLTQIPKEIKDAAEKKLSQSAWIPYWGFSVGFESLKQNKGIIDTVNPVLYSINANGQLHRNNIPERQLQEFLQYCKQNSIKVIPTVSSNNFSNMDKLLSSTANYTQNIQDISTEIKKYSFDGIDLDYEAINLTYKDIYMQYITKLKEILRDSTLSITLLPQWQNAKYTEKEETRSVQDYQRIANIADEIRIMTYDYTSPSSRSAGAIGPIPWVKEVINYTKELNIPSQKVYLGIHLYSYEWNNEKISALTNTTVKSIIEKIGKNAIYNHEIAEGYAQYTCGGNNTCTLYYQTKEGISSRRDLAKRHNLKGVAYWRIGGELDLLK